MNLFERYLSIWVFLCIVVGIALGQLLPGPVQAIGRLEVAHAIGPILGRQFDADAFAAGLDRAIRHGHQPGERVEYVFSHVGEEGHQIQGLVQWLFRLVLFQCSDLK